VPSPFPALRFSLPPRFHFLIFHALGDLFASKPSSKTPVIPVVPEAVNQKKLNGARSAIFFLPVSFFFSAVNYLPVLSFALLLFHFFPVFDSASP